MRELFVAPLNYTQLSFRAIKVFMRKICEKFSDEFPLEGIFRAFRTKSITDFVNCVEAFDHIVMKAGLC